MNKLKKKALVIVAFGTNVQDASHAFRKLEEKVGMVLESVDIYWSYTSASIRKKLKDNGKVILSPEELLVYLSKLPYYKIAVQPLHIIPGSEFSELKKTVNDFKHMFSETTKVQLGKPLLFSPKSLLDVVDALVKFLPDKRKVNEPIVFMGHGTSHEANVYYPALQFYLSRRGQNLYIATIEGYPLLHDILPLFQNKSPGRIWLMPFLSTAGYHARVDMDGYAEGSWRNILENEGFKVQSVLKGLIENPFIQDIWMQNFISILNGEHQ